MTAGAAHQPWQLTVEDDGIEYAALPVTHRISRSSLYTNIFRCVFLIEHGIVLVETGCPRRFDGFSVKLAYAGRAPTA